MTITELFLIKEFKESEITARANLTGCAATPVNAKKISDAQKKLSLIKDEIDSRIK